MVEDFFHLLSGHHLLDESVDLSQVFLLFGEILLAQLSVVPDIERHQKQEEKDDRREPYIQDQQHHDRSSHRDETLDQQREAVVQCLGDRIHIVGEPAHQLPVGVGVEIFQRKLLYMGKQIGADLLHHRLGSVDHQLVVPEARQRSCSVHHSHKDNHPDQAGDILLQHISIDHRLQQIRSVNIGQSAHCHKHGDRGHRHLMAAQIAEDPCNGFSRIFRPFITGCPCHYRFAPSC